MLLFYLLLVTFHSIYIVSKKHLCCLTGSLTQCSQWKTETIKTAGLLSLGLKHLLSAIHTRFVFDVFTPVPNVTQFFVLKHQDGRKSELDQVVSWNLTLLNLFINILHKNMHQTLKWRTTGLVKVLSFDWTYLNKVMKSYWSDLDAHNEVIRAWKISTNLLYLDLNNINKYSCVCFGGGFVR